MSLVVLLLCSCVSSKTYDAGAVFLTDEKTFSLLPVTMMGDDYESYQLITGTFMDSDPMAFEAYIVCNKTTIDISVMSSTGQSIATVIYGAEGVTFSSAFISPAQFRPEYILADIQLLLYPFETLRESLSRSELDFQESVDGDMVIRKLFDGEQLIWTSQQTPYHIHVENALRGYSYDIEVLA